MVGAGQFQGFVENHEPCVVAAGYAAYGAQGAKSQQGSRNFRVPGMIGILVKSRVDVACATLQEQGDGTPAQFFFDDLRSEAGEVRRIGIAGNTQNGMAGEIIDDGQRPPVVPVQAEDADFRVYGANPGDCLVGRE